MTRDAQDDNGREGGLPRHLADGMPVSDEPRWVRAARALSDVIAAGGLLLALVVGVLAWRGQAEAETAGDLVGVVGGVLMAGGFVLNFFIDLVLADRRFTRFGLRVAAPWWVAGVACLATSTYLWR